MNCQYCQKEFGAKGLGIHERQCLLNPVPDLWSVGQRILAQDALKTFKAKKEEGHSIKSILSFECQNCKNSFDVYVSTVEKAVKRGCGVSFCKKECHRAHMMAGTITVSCMQCSEPLCRRASEVKKSKTKRFFCDSSCAALFNNSRKEKGVRVSKMEKWVSKRLGEIFPSLNILYNDRKTLIRGLELDVYIPILNVAFEISGIHHVKPIYGEAKLAQIIERDSAKKQDCVAKHINLYTIDTSQLKRFTPESCQKYLDFIVEKVRAEGLEPPTVRLFGGHK